MFISRQLVGILALTSAFVLVDSIALAVDIDQNGIDDSVEKIWAERYKPSFFVHNGNPLEPEPVEILDRTGDGKLSIEDVSCWVTNNGVDGTRLFEGEYCNYDSGGLICTGGRAFSSLRTPTQISGNVSMYSYLDYGGPGNENPEDWYMTYSVGWGTTKPGDDYSPKVYCHLFKEESNKIQVQYWYYYPYDDAYNQHEGDWEHIAVILESDGQSEHAVFHGVIYYSHEFYMETSSMMTWVCPADDYAFAWYYPYMIDETHPVVFVGGSTSIVDQLGACSGASWPCFGEFPLPGFINPEVEKVYAGGPVLRYNEIEVEIIPDFAVGVPISGDMADWLASNPDKQWMLAELMWGYPISESPLNFGNQAPMTPASKGAWRDPYPGLHAGDEGIDYQICIRKPIVLVSAARLNDERQPLSASYSIQIDGNGPIYTSGTKIQELDRSQTHTVTVSMDALITREDGSRAQFVGWSDGSSSRQKTVNYNPSALSPGEQVILDFHALYREAGPEWTDIGAQVFGTQSGVAGAWGDYDNDGLDDLLLLDTPTSRKLFRNTGTGFEERPFPATFGAMKGAVWGDLDGDDDLDLCLIPFINEEIQIFINSGGTFGEPVFVYQVEASFAGGSCVDVDQDGDLDIVLYGDLANPAQMVVVNIGENNEFYCDSYSMPRSLAGAAWADYDGDSDLDMCALGNTDLVVPLLRNNGTAFVADEVYIAPEEWNRTAFSAAWVDYDNDGDLDLHHNCDIYRNDGPGGRVRAYSFPIADPQDAVYANWADFNSDGWIDVIINGRLYRNDHGEFVDLTGWIEWPAARTSRWEWVDYDGDGDLDLFSFGNPLQLMENTEDVAGRFVKVDLHGAVSNRHGVGTALHFPNGLRPLCQNSGVANSATRSLIGVGGLEGTYGLGVTWPSGTRHTVQVGAGVQSISIVEPTGIAQFNSNPLLADGIERDYVLAVRISPLVPVLNAAVDVAAFGPPGTLPLKDDGLGADAAAGDGIYTSAFFRTTLDYFQYYYPRVTADLADGTHLERRVEVLLVSQDTNLPTIAPQAAYRVRAGSTDASTVFAVAIEAHSAPIIVSADLTNIGGAESVALRDDGLGEDVKQGDGIYTSPALLATVSEPGSLQVPVTAARLSGAATEQTVGVVAIANASKFKDDARFGEGEQIAGDLSTLLASRPYSSALFKSVPADDASDDVMIVTFDDNSTTPLLVARAGSGGGTPHFVDRSVGSDLAWLSAPLPMGSRGVCYADFDNDGDTDFFISSPMRGGKLYENNLSTIGVFSDVTAAFFGGDIGLLDGAVTASWGDYDGDGFVDLFVATTTYLDPVDDLPAVDPVSTQQSTSGGMNSPGDLRIFRSDGGTALRKTFMWGGAGSSPCLAGCWIDLNNDADLDLVYTRVNDDRLWVIENTGINQAHTDQEMVPTLWPISSTFAGGTSVSVIDYDHDLYPDLLITEAGQFHQARVLRNNFSNAQDRSFASTDFGSGTAWNGAIVADFNLDGQEDFVLLPKDADVNPAFIVSSNYMIVPEYDGDPMVQEASSSTTTPLYRNLGYTLGLRDGKTGGGFAADLNSDHVCDLFLGRANGDQFLYRNDTGAVAPGHWIGIKLKSLGNSNMSLIGTKVSVTYGADKRWTRIVDGGSGRGGQDARSLVFGLGDVAGPVNVKMSYPSGDSLEVTLNVDDTYSFDENGGVTFAVGTTDMPNPACEYELGPGVADFIFKWRTVGVKGDITKDAVLVKNFASYGATDPCYVGIPALQIRTIQWGDSDAEFRVYRDGANWQHVVRWRALPCAPNCLHSFKVKSAVGIATNQTTNFVRTTATTFCVEPGVDPNQQ